MNKTVEREIFKRGLSYNNHTHNPHKTLVKTIFTDRGEKVVPTF